MAFTIEQCDSMLDAARKAGTLLIVGHSHSFNRPILRLRELIEDGEFGAVRMISALNSPILYRPRRPEEPSRRRAAGSCSVRPRTRSISCG